MIIKLNIFKQYVSTDVAYFKHINLDFSVLDHEKCINHRIKVN